jgi:hypothetical protein
MSLDSFKTLVKKALYEDKHGPLPGNPDVPTSSLFVVQELEQLGFVYEYLSKPAEQNTCFPTVIVYTTTGRGLPIERAIQLVHDSKPRQVRHQHGVITVWYGREPNDPSNPEHYKFFLGIDKNSRTFEKF